MVQPTPALGWKPLCHAQTVHPYAKMYDSLTSETFSFKNYDNDLKLFIY